MSISSEVKDFYSKHHFPGRYTNDQIKSIPNNRYIKKLIEYIPTNGSVLDAGCGTGLITHLIANNFSEIDIVGIDFADSITFGKDFAVNNNINNIKFIQTDILSFTSDRKFDIIISMGLLHHMPDYIKGAEKIKSLLKPNGILILGSFYPTGTYIKKLFNIQFKNKTFNNDQYNNPYEISFNVSQIKNLFHHFTIIDSFPKITWLLPLKMIFNYKNNGLLLYILKHDQN